MQYMEKVEEGRSNRIYSEHGWIWETEVSVFHNREPATFFSRNLMRKV